MGVGDELKDQLSFLGGFKLTFQHLTSGRGSRRSTPT